MQDAPDELMVIFLDDGKEILEKTQLLLDRWIRTPKDMRLIDGLQCELHTLKGSVNMVGIAPMGKLSHHLENILKQIHEGTVQPNTKVQQLVQQSVDELTDMLSAVRSGAPLDSPSEFIEQLNEAALESEQESEAPDELMEIFLEEADEILEKTQLLLERWITAPNDQQLIKEIQRELHTIKGGARMVGITPMGELSHHLEDIFRQIIEKTAQPNTRLQDIVQQSVDELAAMLESVRSGVSVNNPTELIEQIKAALGLDKAAPPTSIAPPPSKANFDEEGSRVRAILIDKLTQMARELYLYRTNIVQQQGTFKNHLADLEQTLIRLDSQLEQEIEAPLSRPLTGILNHLKKIQNAFKNQTRQSDSLLIQQSSIGVELQDCIMRTRMISPTDSDKKVDIELPHAKKTIMIVNESVAVRKLTIGLLGRQGFEVLTAKDGIEAVDQLRDKIPDLMVIDTKLQRMDGYKLATQVRNHPDWKHLPIIMITAHAGTQSREKTEQLGINRFLGKPYKESELLENINALLAEMEAKKAEMEAKKTIMVVDDSISVRRVANHLLKRQGFEVQTAKDGIDALAQLQANVPDLMLLDVEMPRMDGYELADQVRNHPNWKHLPIIMITSRTGHKHHKDKAEKIRINRFLGKPYKESELLENINALLAEMGT
jgi:CheY-like chemotaxis protein